MKRLFSLLTVLLCAVMLSSTVFAADADAYALYQKYVKKSQSVSSMEMSLVQRLSMTDGDQSVELTKQNASIKMIISKDKKLEMEVKITDSATNETSNAYFKDNYLYEKVGNEKFKIKMDMNDALNQTANMDYSLTREDFKDAKVEKVDGGTKLTYKVKLDKNGSMASMLKDIELPDDIKLSFSSITCSMTLGDDGSLKSYTSSFGINMSDGKDTAKLKMTQSAKVKSVNSVSKINFPTDLNTYKELKA